ncbi:hypothetical protein QZH41_016963 [Actinostola sp. cb2023]|nr:hypothetical protein QZH41_016963 [Actinostola sp. cb2023]
MAKRRLVLFSPQILKKKSVQESWEHAITLLPRIHIPALRYLIDANAVDDVEEAINSPIGPALCQKGPCQKSRNNIFPGFQKKQCFSKSDPVHDGAHTLNMAAAPNTKPNGDKVRKRSFSGGLPLLNRSGSMADKTLLGVLNILRMDDEPANTFLVRTILPDGNLRLVSADRNMIIRDLVSGIVQEFHLDNYQVRELPGKTITNLDAKATCVEYSEIAIEDVERKLSNFELDNIHAIKDARLRCVKELQHEEESFFNDLKCLVEVYGEPLRKWGLPRADYKVLFEPLETICNLNVRMNTLLQEAVRSWDTSKTLIGRIFTDLDILWSTYEDYFQSFRGTRTYLRQKRDYDADFQSFVNLQRGARNSHLELLFFRPIQHVTDYDRILSNLLDKTPPDHPDREDLEHAATNFRRVSFLAELIMKCTCTNSLFLILPWTFILPYTDEDCPHIDEQWVKINQVQDKFPHDNLCITEGDVLPLYTIELLIPAIPSERSQKEVCTLFSAESRSYTKATFSID